MSDMSGIWRCRQCDLEVQPERHVAGGPGLEFRWAGDHWQHHHDYPVGHCPMVPLLTRDHRCTCGRPAVGKYCGICGPTMRGDDEDSRRQR